jgi:hypothetical protein
MTYAALSGRLPLSLTIPSLGGRKSLTIYNLQGGIMVENSKGSTYHITAADWDSAKRIRTAYPRNPWQSTLYSGLSEFYSYSLIYAAALLRHIEFEEAGAIPSRSLIRFHRKAQDQSAA